MWRNATTQHQRDLIFEQHGLRWSELLRLPYWDPTRFAVLDAMHNIFLGEYRTHCRSIWGIDVKSDRRNGVKAKEMLPHDPDTQRKMLDSAVVAIRRGSKSGLTALRKGYIEALARTNYVEPEGFKKIDYVEALIKWVSLNAAVL